MFMNPLLLLWIIGVISVLVWVEKPSVRIPMRTIVEEMARSGEIPEDAIESCLVAIKLQIALLWPVTLAQWIAARTRGDR